MKTDVELVHYIEQMCAVCLVLLLMMMRKVYIIYTLKNLNKILYIKKNTGTHGSEPLPVMLFVHQVIASPESHQMGVVSWCWDGN